MNTVPNRKDRVSIYEGAGIYVAASDYIDTAEEAILHLDEVVSSASSVEFTLAYPFEKPFTAAVTGEITLRRIIDGVRHGIRSMYEDTCQQDIPNMCNKEVTGPYGRAFHEIGDLVIERIELCHGRRLDIFIGS